MFSSTKDSQKEPNRHEKILLYFGMSYPKIFGVIGIAISILFFFSLRFLHEYPHFIPALFSGHFETLMTERHRAHFSRPVTAIAWNRDGSQLAAINGSNVTIFNTAAWAKINEFRILFQAETLRSLAFLTDGSLIAAAPDSANRPAGHKALARWNVITASQIQSYPDLEKSPSSLVKNITHPADNFAISQNGQLAASFFLDDKVFLIDVEDGVLLRQLQLPMVPAPPPMYAPPPAEERLIHDSVSSAAFSPNSKELAVCGLSGYVRIYRIEDGQLIRSIAAFDSWKWCTALAYSADGQFLAVGRESLQEIPLGRQPVIGDKSQLEADTGGVRIFRALDGSLLNSIAGIAGTVWSLSWSLSENNILAAGVPGSGGSAKVWRINEEGPTLVLNVALDHGSSRVAFSPKGDLAIGETANGNLLVYR